MIRRAERCCASKSRKEVATDQNTGVVIGGAQDGGVGESEPIMFHRETEQLAEVIRLADIVSKQ